MDRRDLQLLRLSRLKQLLQPCSLFRRQERQQDDCINALTNVSIRRQRCLQGFANQAVKVAAAPEDGKDFSSGTTERRRLPPTRPRPPVASERAQGLHPLPRRSGAATSSAS